MAADSNLKQRLFSWGLLLLLLIAPLYNQVNIGTSGLNLTYNISAWIVASWMLAAGLLLITTSHYFFYPQGWIYFVLFPFIVITNILWIEIDLSVIWFFRLLFILGGLMFLFALFQFSARQVQLDRALYVITLSMVCQALLGALQIADADIIRQLVLEQGTASTETAQAISDEITIAISNIVPSGNFQQINVQASFLVTGLMATFYLISRPVFRSSNKISQAIVVVSVALAIYIVSASGSRIGLLSLTLGMPILLWSRHHQLCHHKKLLVVLFIVSCVSVVAGWSAWSDRKAIQKANSVQRDRVAGVTPKEYPVSRVDIYMIGLELIAKQPIYGYGVGGFLKAWNEQMADFARRYPEGRLPVDSPILHPHNEILFWAIEGGLLTVIGLLAVVVGIILALKRCGWQRGGAYLAMLLPISLHTQVELPFYHSAVHWFLWLFLVYLVLRHQTSIINIKITPAAIWLLRIAALMIGSTTTVFMLNTARAQTDLYRFLYEQEKAQQPYLQYALNNLYLKSEAERIAMRTNLYAYIEQNNRQEVEKFEKWARNYIITNPRMKIYEDLISASVFLRPDGKGCDYITAGLAMYPYNKHLKKAYAIRCLPENN